jgi:RNA polymerase subunit RPABC4/transcription elongation factor Spt4
MALIHCPECQKEVSSVALACPQCAFPHPGRKGTENGHYEKALRTCPDCKRIISRQIEMCPHCGAPASGAEEKPEPLAMAEGEETLMCPHCGVSFTRGPKARKPVEEVDSLLPIDEKVLAAQSRIGLEFEEAGADDELTGDPSFPVGKRKKPLWGEKNESFRESPRHSRPKNSWNTYLLVLLVILLLVTGWAIWELRDMSGLEALVYWNR